MNTKNASAPSSASVNVRSRGSSSSGSGQWIHLAPSFADWRLDESGINPGYRSSLERDIDDGGVALELARRRNTQEEQADISAGWRKNIYLEKGCIVRAHIETDFLHLDPVGSVLKAEGYLSLATLGYSRADSDALAQAGSSITLEVPAQKAGIYRIRVGSLLANSDAVTGRPSAASRVFITVEHSVSIQAPEPATTL